MPLDFDFEQFLLAASEFAPSVARTVPGGFGQGVPSTAWRKLKGRFV